MSVSLLAQLEAISRGRPDRVLRLRGTLPALVGAGGEGTGEEFELLIFRGFSSSLTHPTDFDPDQPALPEGVRLESAELLQGPLNPGHEQLLAGPGAAELFLDPSRW
ncbi:hypothetical protein [Synechococcus sp. CBW1107]|uniref:DUF7734 family protein n=1 Tax=Synechococcus sp. CBW1107 TaxID=2789857 RepID=UPI002AD320B7|nr:hypothetical protein [Synechococcus sp. CBW1107]CAK6697830.1 hypothetical protein ICNINCKA_02307 [Synechococcus sp. CBW1107]